MSYLNEKTEFDVIIIGAGIAGIAAARVIKENCPNHTLAVLESKPTYGGTWYIHRYPGVRSDSDLFTLGYKTKPWTGDPIASGAEIMKYMGEAIDEADLTDHIRYQRKLISASWSSLDRRWSLRVECVESGEMVTYHCRFLLMFHGYYRHEAGYVPDWPGFDKFRGQVIHPQNWPEDFHGSGKRVIVIGSGATAATLVPELADQCAHVTMLQRSPTFFLITENKNVIADRMRELGLPKEWVHETARRDMLMSQKEFFDYALANPDDAAESLIESVRSIVGADYDVEKHFRPRYNPGTQRTAFIPGGNLFHKIAEGKVTVITDEIHEFNETGILTKGGDQLDADVIVTATGFNMSLTMDICFDIDGSPVDFANEYTYYGLLTSNVPNLIFNFGYLYTSWTMRAELLANVFCKLLRFMSERGYASCTPRLRPQDEGMTQVPFIPPSLFNPGYVSRQIHQFQKQGSELPWQVQGNYFRDREIFENLNFDDDILEFGQIITEERPLSIAP
jgi:cation diffusion facilitator CzcD-associated flavoprotein CzcO